MESNFEKIIEHIKKFDETERAEKIEKVIMITNIIIKNVAITISMIAIILAK